MSLEDRIRDLKVQTDVCPTCRQRHNVGVECAAPSWESRLRRENQTLRARVAELEQKNDGLHTVCGNNSREIERLNKRERELLDHVRELERESVDLREVTLKAMTRANKLTGKRGHCE